MSLLKVERLTWAEAEVAWRSILGKCPRSTIFESAAFVGAGARHLYGDRLILSLVTEAGTPVGAAAWVAGRRSGLRYWTLRRHDTSDIIASEGREPEVVVALLNWLKSARREWDWVDAKGARPDGVLLSSLPKKPGLPLSVVEEPSQHAARLPGTWEDYEAALGRNLRQQLRQFLRKCEREAGPVAFTVATPSTVHEDMTTFFALHQRRWEAAGQAGLLSDRAVQDFHRDAAEACAREGSLRLHLMRVAGEPVAALYAFASRGEVAYYLSGSDPAFAPYRVGKLVMAEAIRSAILEGASWFDFLHGEESYKERWATEPRQRARIVVSSGGVRSRVNQWAMVAQPKVKSWLKKMRRSG